jgi:hypothetical protein
MGNGHDRRKIAKCVYLQVYYDLIPRTGTLLAVIDDLAQI